jgi:hypothetical protein
LLHLLHPYNNRGEPAEEFYNISKGRGESTSFVRHTVLSYKTMKSLLIILLIAIIPPAHTNTITERLAGGIF